jgi:hypothetical protein
MTNVKTKLITDSKEIKLIGFYLERKKKITKQEPLGKKKPYIVSHHCCTINYRDIGADLSQTI